MVHGCADTQAFTAAPCGSIPEPFSTGCAPEMTGGDEPRSLPGTMTGREGGEKKMEKKNKPLRQCPRGSGKPSWREVVIALAMAIRELSKLIQLYIMN